MIGRMGGVGELPSGMSGLPSGTVTFLFTDIERSTQSAETLGNERWAEALERHRELLRPAFQRFGGVEVGREGDSFFVAFARAGDAVQAAVDGQKALAGGSELRVRMGMHTGEALVRDGDYVGHDVHKAKRISDAGHGGQIVASQTTADLVASTVQLLDLGPHRLKDLGEPQRIFQVGTQAFPPLRSLESFTNNLPLTRSSFVGREDQIATVRKLLDRHRLVTLTGIGGCGKTRLSLQVGAELLEHFPDGVFFTELGPVSDPSLVPVTIAKAVGFPLTTGIGPDAMNNEPIDALLGFLARRTCLIVLDNCEHLIESCAEVVDRIQRRCPDVSILATSREVLGVDGEQAMGVPSLALPDGNATASEAVTLFVQRAQAVRPDFELTQENGDRIVEICRRLDGIPLAIEFAAARVSHLSPRQIAQKLDDRFRLLTGGRRHVQRQQTMQAALDWSYDLASDAERTLLRRLAVFPADFSLATAESVCSDEYLAAADITDLVGSLVAKSLVEVEPSNDDVRYRLLESVRAYAAERLAHAGEADIFRDRHRDHFVALMDAVPWEERFSVEHAERLRPDLTDLRYLTELSEEQGRVDLAVRLVAGSMAIWMMGEFTMAEGRRFSAAAMAIEETLPPDLRALVLTNGAQFALLDRDPESAFMRSDRAVALAREAHPVLLAYALAIRSFLGGVIASFTKDEAAIAGARNDVEEALTLALGRFPEIASFAVQQAANNELMLENVPAAVDLLERGLATLDEKKHAVPLFAHGYLLGICLHVLGESARAFEQMTASLANERVRTIVSSLASAAAPIAPVDLQRAIEVVTESMERISRDSVPGSLEELVCCVANVFTTAGDDQRAATLLGWIRAQTIERGIILRSPAMFILYRKSISNIQDALDAATIERCRVEGRSMTTDQAVALVFEGLERIDG